MHVASGTLPDIQIVDRSRTEISGGSDSVGPALATGIGIMTSNEYEQQKGDDETAYMFGGDYATDERYTGREWDEIEPEVRASWEARGKGKWDDFKDAVRQGWDEMRNKPAA
jgi:hypothetical protein